MWTKMLNIRLANRFRVTDPEEGGESLTKTNTVTTISMKPINMVVQEFLRLVEVPIYGGAVLAILVIGEWNFFSEPVRYQTEPLASIGELMAIPDASASVEL